MVVVDRRVAAASYLLASVSDHLTPAIAVLVDSFTEADFAIDCDGCTACCRGHEGVKLDDDEVMHFSSYKDAKGEYRMTQVDGECINLGNISTKVGVLTMGCTIHDNAPRRCREFDCRAAVITYSQVGIDELVAKGELPLAVVEMGRMKLDEWNNAMNVCALSGGGDLTFLMEDDDEHRPSG